MSDSAVLYELPPLPVSGKKVVLRQITGEDELAAAREVSDDDGGAAQIVHSYALIQRAIVSIDGQPFDRSTTVGVGVRNLFDPRDWQCLNRAFNRLHVPDKADLDSFLAGIVVSAR
jgi:hypothetical protein